MKKYTTTEKDNYIYVKNHEGKDIAYSKESGISILEIDGFAFKDLNGNGVLDPYEDWRLPIEERIEDLSRQMTVEQIAGLMLYSQHQSVSTEDSIFAKMFAGTYDGKSLQESGKDISDLTDQQKKFLKEDNLRHILLTLVNDAKTAAKWNNNVQGFVEGLGLGIPANNSSDPRHTPSADTEFNSGAGGDISKWPEPLGLAATFDTELVRGFGQVASKEYRALGITTALSPQVDIATEPRWMRFNGTFGEDSVLSTHMAEAYCDGFQTTEETKGWGKESVNAMVKHWPGGGSGEAGRDAHYGFGKYAVYPGNNFEEHLKPFTEGAFKLKNGTKEASAVMPYYTISYNQDHKYNENVGNSYNKFIITDLLRNKYNYDGVVCTDWMITKDAPTIDSFLVGKCWGVETMGEAERHYKILMAGVDQFGGNNEIQPILDAYNMGVKEHGGEFMRNRFETSGKRLLRNIFKTGLFENPYVDPQESEVIVGNKEFMKDGYNGQLKSIVMLKNKNNTLPISENEKVYIPKRRLKEGMDWFGNIIPASEIFPVEKKIVEKYYTVVGKPEEADFAIVFIESPDSVGYKKEEGYIPVTLQYRPYTAEYAREESIANDDGESRSYKNKSNTATNEKDLDIILETKEAMKDKPVIISMNCKNPTVVSEFENRVESILINFNVQTQAVLDLISGRQEPSGLLPFQMPKDMKTVEEQKEDTAHDMECYVDEDGHIYDFAYGMNYKGIIVDERVNKYKK
ncbi:glycoside hydrolase family 3 C-terminal domain-containing protein [Clostridium gasigenes]|uniref:glycoside hydrolase family 3 protein n=1 Tax=Clostridium gasigenes TaxID=94869 RepID=UPI001C0C68C9|nr:glycoside hydrolase family 3 N-terminal domain-containing protein [Clostridium gasigenes]MBU3087198.1 glycoside hydrolase family 3 C-terminal domain-containing protein [Clostridium gasigenes]